MFWLPRLFKYLQFKYLLNEKIKYVYIYIYIIINKINIIKLYFYLLYVNI